MTALVVSILIPDLSTFTARRCKCLPCRRRGMWACTYCEDMQLELLAVVSRIKGGSPDLQRPAPGLRSWLAKR